MPKLFLLNTCFIECLNLLNIYSDVNVINVLLCRPKLEEMTSVRSSSLPLLNAGGFSQVIFSKFRLVHFLKALKIYFFLLIPLADYYTAVFE